jgi:hypothetical protein
VTRCLYVALVILVGAAVYTERAQAHLVERPKATGLEARLVSQQANYAHARFVCNRGANANRRWHCVWVPILERELAKTRYAIHVRQRRAQAQAAHTSEADARRRNIGAATQVYHEQGCTGRRCDPWPNCPDPFDGRGSWDDLKRCESGTAPWTVGRLAGYCGPLQIHLRYWAHIIRRWGLPC